MDSKFNPNHFFPSSGKPLILSNDDDVVHSSSTDSCSKLLVIKGGNKLSGHVSISGSKNAALPLLAATLCCSGTSKLTNVPNISDTRMMVSILSSLGAQVEFSANDNEVVVNTDPVRSVEPDPALLGRIRAGFFVIGPLVGRFGEAVVGLPGGCDVGARPVDIFLSGLRALGAVVEVRDNKVLARAANGKGLVGSKFRLRYPSVGATETIMMAACLAEGKTLLSNVSRDPEIVDLASFLAKCGARIEGAGTAKISIHGKSSTSRLVGTEYSVMPDRVEAGTFILAAAITRSHISLSPVFPGSISTLIHKLSGAGCKFVEKDDTLEVSAIPSNSDEELRGFDIKTVPYPGFPTDFQPQTMALLTTCKGLSLVEETVYENRMTHVSELQKLGAKIEVRGTTTALIHGKGNGNKLCGARVVSKDLRCGASLVLAGLAAEGITEIEGVSYIERGYENLVMKLRNLGADIKMLDFSSTPFLQQQP